MGAGASQRPHHWPDRDWQNLAGLCVGPASVPRRLDRALPPPPAVPPGTAHCEGRWTLWEAADDAGQNRRLNPTATLIIDIQERPRYHAPAYSIHRQEAAHVTSLSDRRHRICHSPI